MMQPGSDVLGIEHLYASRERFVAYVRNRVDEPELAEDIVHDSLLRALRAAPDLRENERLLPWFFRILRNAIVYRKRGVAGRHVDPAGDLPDVPDLSGEDEKTFCSCFRALLPALKPEYAELIEALDLAEEAPAAVAQRLGITTNNPKVRRRRARQALRSWRTRAAHALRGTVLVTAPADRSCPASYSTIRTRTFPSRRGSRCHRCGRRGMRARTGQVRARLSLSSPRPP